VKNLKSIARFLVSIKTELENISKISKYSISSKEFYQKR